MRYSLDCLFDATQSSLQSPLSQAHHAHATHSAPCTTHPSASVLPTSTLPLRPLLLVVPSPAFRNTFASRQSALRVGVWCRVVLYTPALTLYLNAGNLLLGHVCVVRRPRSSHQKQPPNTSASYPYVPLIIPPAPSSFDPLFDLTLKNHTVSPCRPCLRGF